MKFKSALLVSCALIVGTLLALIFNIKRISSSDQKEYQALMELPQGNSKYATSQEREGGVKTLILSQNGERKLGVLKSTASTLSYSKEGPLTELLEEMQNPLFTYQEELLENNMQLVVKVEGEKALYNYTKELLTLNGAIISRYKIPGHHFPGVPQLAVPVFSGTADSIVLYRDDLEPHMKAIRVKGTVQFGFEVGEASFEGGELHGSCGVAIDHPMGQIEAKSFVATFPDGNWTEIPREVTLNEGVHIHLAGNSEMQAPFATLDCTRWLALLHGFEGNKASYAHGASGWGLKSLEMRFQLTPNGQVEHLEAEGEVEIDGAGGLHLEGEKAYFEDWPPRKQFSKATLFAKDLNSECLIESPESTIHCQEIALDLEKKEVSLLFPHGSVSRSELPLHFKARSLKMEKDQGKMGLTPPISLEWGGHLELLGPAELTQEIKKGKRTLAFFESTGPLNLTMKDSEFGLEHTLSASGKTTIDHRENTIAASSPQDARGGVLESEQIHFHDLYGDIYADQMTLHYRNEKGHLEPVKIILLGNVRLLNKALGQERYALADQAEFQFSSSELTLKSKKRARVLFYDEINHVQASAPALVLKRDPETGKDQVKGLGNVRFIFAEEELNELKKRFSFGN